jgi:hypothetical protein
MNHVLLSSSAATSHHSAVGGDTESSIYNGDYYLNPKSQLNTKKFTIIFTIIMSEVNEVKRKQCLYRIRQGKNQGHQCVNLVSKNDPQLLLCTAHHKSSNQCMSRVCKEKSKSSLGSEKIDEGDSEKIVAPKPMYPVKVDTPPTLIRTNTFGDYISEDQEKSFEQRYQEEKILYNEAQLYRSWRNKRMINP